MPDIHYISTIYVTNKHIVVIKSIVLIGYYNV